MTALLCLIKTRLRTQLSVLSVVFKDFFIFFVWKRETHFLRSPAADDEAQTQSKQLDFG